MGIASAAYDPGAWLSSSGNAGKHVAAAGKFVTPSRDGLGSSVAMPPREPQVVVIGGPGSVVTFDGGRYRAAIARGEMTVGHTPRGVVSPGPFGTVRAPFATWMFQSAGSTSDSGHCAGSGEENPNVA